MAYVSNAAAHRSHAPLAFVGRALRALGTALMRSAESNHRVVKVQKLLALSDAELAKRGLKREDVVHHVYGEMMYL